MELFKLFGTILVDNEKANQSIRKTDQQANGLSKSLSTAFSAAGKAVVAGTAIAAAAIIGVTKSAADAYAEYEQLVGGVDTLFGESSAKVQQYAQNAYRTAGMSANAYMETVTSFSASLLSSLGGDSQKAADIADQAIVDMADNANKMGTSVELIQNAYQGFAKQNYTMLDNLKLGYGGTKTEMMRLLEDANKINAQNGKNTDYTIENFSDIIEAIHVVQNEMGIAGATAEEAAGTISGSTAAMSAAWKNLLAGMGDDNADMAMLVDNFVDSAVMSFDNLLPRIGEILVGIGELVEGIIPVIAEKLPGLVATLLPPLIQGAATLVAGLVAALPELLVTLWNMIPVIMESLWTAIGNTFPGFYNKVNNFINNIKETVRAGIEKVKSFFRFEWSLPKIKLPHFNISGGFSLNPPSIPSFSVDWYAKAMDNPMLLTDPTIFGYNSATGKFLGGGEAGAEVVSGANTLMNMIQGAVATQNEALVAVLHKILEAILVLDANMGGNMREAMEGLTFDINKREFARLVKGVT